MLGISTSELTLPSVSQVTSLFSGRRRCTTSKTHTKMELPQLSRWRSHSLAQVSPCCFLKKLEQQPCDVRDVLGGNLLRQGA